MGQSQTCYILEQGLGRKFIVYDRKLEELFCCLSVYESQASELEN